MERTSGHHEGFFLPLLWVWVCAPKTEGSVVKGKCLQIATEKPSSRSIPIVS